MSVLKKLKTSMSLEQIKDALKCGEYYKIVKSLQRLIWLEEADVKDKGYACWMLAKAYTKGLWGRRKDEEKVTGLLKRGAEFGDELSMAELSITRPIRYTIAQLDLQKQIMKSDNNYAKARLEIVQYHPCVEKILFHLEKSDKEDVFVKYDYVYWKWQIETPSELLLKIGLEEAAILGNPYAQDLLSSNKSITTFARIQWFKKAALQGCIKERYRGYENYNIFENCVNAIVCLLCVKKYYKNNCGLLSLIPFDIVKMIAKHMKVVDIHNEDDFIWHRLTPEWHEIERYLDDQYYNHYSFGIYSHLGY
jgi:TPR repeat protein